MEFSSPKPSNKEVGFQINDLVFAKVKGHPAWPAVITNIDSKSFKTVIKYDVLFFTTKTTATLNKSDLFTYKENASKYTIESVSSRHKDTFKNALAEISKAFEMASKSQKTPKSSTNAVMTQKHVPSSTPKSERAKHSPNKSLETINDSVVSLDTPKHLDVNYQLSAITDRCIELEKELMELKNSNCETKEPQNLDFQTQILLEELNKYKLECKNLQSVIELLQSEHVKLEEELKQKVSANKCLNCFPTLKNSSKGNEWQVVNKKPMRSTHQMTRVTECSNSFDVLAHEDTGTSNSQLTHLQITEQNKSLNKLHKNGSKPKHTSCKVNQNCVKEPKPKLIILGDSHGNDLSHLIEQRTAFDVTSYTRPGASFEQVIEELSVLSKGLGMNDRLLVVGGTNSVQSTAVINITDTVHDVIRNSKHTNLILAALPMRHDTPLLDLKISRINAEVERITMDNEISLLPLHLLPRHLYTNHGLHFNKRGKTRIAQMIADILNNKQTTNQIKARSLNYTPVNTNTKQKINIVEADMLDTFDQWKMDPSAAFAHTISADFDHPRRMSAGVAVLFRRKFGRPIVSDYIEKNLTCQKFKNGAAIYSLVTKSNFYGKPQYEDYDSAFTQLTQDFKKRELKTLICSPMGCVRDLVKPDHFIKRLKEFQESTQATIYVITYSQVSHRVLRNGLSHAEFLKTLQDAVAATDVLPTTINSPKVQQCSSVVSQQDPLMNSYPTMTPTTVSDLNCNTNNNSSMDEFLGFSTPNTSVGLKNLAVATHHSVT